ncbi:MAG TPA: KH domain-containing protein [Candidatus Acidoferrales bacterium]|nr:KH domain-containing protein [Candidatus Acidoferrales bacterium]
MKELVEAIAKALVDNPDQVQVHLIEGEQVTVFESRVHPSDLGKVIGPAMGALPMPSARSWLRRA